MTRYLGGLITKDESLVIPADNFETTSAPGVWTLEEAQMLAKQGLWPTAGNANNGRAVFCGGSLASTGNQTDTMDYIEINTAGNATDFGDLTANALNNATMSSSTRGVIQSGSDSNILQYITIASTGNATDFGDATQNRQNIPFGASNSTRGINGGGLQNSVYRDQVDYITIASTGNAQDFGEFNSRSLWSSRLWVFNKIS